MGMNTMNKKSRTIGTPGYKKFIRQPVLLTRNSRTEPLWNNRTIALVALATVAVIGLISMSETSSPTHRRMPTELRKGYRQHTIRGGDDDNRIVYDYYQNPNGGGACQCPSPGYGD